MVETERVEVTASCRGLELRDFLWTRINCV